MPTDKRHYGGHEEDVAFNSPRMMFSQQLIALGRIDTGVLLWEVAGKKVTCTHKATGVQRIWMLTGIFDDTGCQLGRWPD